MTTKIRNTTALVAAFSLAIPAVAPAQQMVDRCEAGSIGISADVASELELTLTDAQKAALEGEASTDDVIVSTFGDEPELCMTMAELEEMGASEADVVMAVEAEASDAEMTGETTAEAEAEVEAEAEETAEADTEDKGLLESALDAVTGNDEPAEAEAEAEATAEAEAEAEVEAEITAEAEPEAEAETEMAEEAAPEAEAEGEGNALSEALGALTGDEPAEAEATAETEAEAEAEAEMAAEAESEAEMEAEVTAEAEADAEATTETDEAMAEAETETDAEAEAAVEADAAANPDMPDPLKELTEAIEAQSAEEANPEEQAAVAENEAPEASAASDENAEVAEVEEETVTEDSSRSSSEEFDQKVSGAATASAGSKKDGGLSDLEKALLVGLGAVVVGKALEGNDKAQVVTKSDDRVVVLEDGRYRVIRDDNELIERPGSTVRRETFNDGSTRTTVTRENGVQIVTIRDPELRVLRRTRIDADGNRTVLIDDTTSVDPVDVAALPDPVEYEQVDANSDAEALRAALSTKSIADRRFALYQVRNIERVRKLAPAIDLDAINFRTGSAVIDAQEAEELSQLGNLIRDYVEQNPGEVFLVEGHTDAVGNAAYNLALSDRRAESVALALTEYFDVPPENLVVQGYGESDLKIRTLTDERANRRAAVRRITPLIASGS
ncbi:OmpA family protein [Oceanicola sp. 502str15]|uniref:OmpA family protein n=1 Tax=Oceanicola sp. 502str15 TaxID=2696061 RepID=UPI00209629A1|nr:OmpA family protein [Oceanicola sp. 502str15]MCO6381712.1 OmpA family protein [Oceanicola sp. 502str15]